MSDNPIYSKAYERGHRRRGLLPGGEASGKGRVARDFSIEWGQRRTSALFFPSSADVVTIAPSGCILRFVFEPVFVPGLSARSFAAFATIEITRAERRRIAGEIDVGILFRWRAGANQRNCDQEGKFLHCQFSPSARWHRSSRQPPRFSAMGSFRRGFYLAAHWAGCQRGSGKKNARQGRKSGVEHAKARCKRVTSSVEF